jgi:hypothetical protein
LRICFETPSHSQAFLRFLAGLWFGTLFGPSSIEQETQWDAVRNLNDPQAFAGKLISIS